MQLPMTLYLHALEPKETSLVREIVQDAKNRGLFEQSQFMGDGVDVRNFLTSKKPRPSAQLLAKLYNWIMSDLLIELRPLEYEGEAEQDAKQKIAEKVRQLYDLGQNSKRYSRDVTVSMNKFIDGDILEYNLPTFALRNFIGYRLRTEGRQVLRFLVELFFDPKLGRTMFRSFLRLQGSDEPRETRGFAYTAKDNIYLAGFINARLGCEFMALRRSHTQKAHFYSGLITTTSPDGSPVSKSCVLIDAAETRFQKYLRPNDMLRLDTSKLKHPADRYIVPLDITALKDENFEADLAALLASEDEIKDDVSLLMASHLDPHMMRLEY
jgi:hypothetical protein